jgi:hypothetical protein
MDPRDAFESYDSSQTGVLSVLRGLLGRRLACYYLDIYRGLRESSIHLSC